MGLESSFTLLRDLGEIALTGREAVRFSIDAYRGYRYISVRKYITTDGFTGPTQDGVTLTPDIVRALVPRLLALPADAKALTLGSVGKFAKRPGICIVATVAEINGLRGLDLRQWEQDKGFTKKGVFLPLSKWAETRKLFADTVAALDEQPDAMF